MVPACPACERSGAATHLAATAPRLRPAPLTTAPRTPPHHLRRRLTASAKAMQPPIETSNDSATAAYRAGFGAKPNPMLLSATVWSIEAVFGLEGPVCLGDYVIP